MAKCGRCGGTGRTFSNEDGVQGDDACYHCCETGVIDEETSKSDFLNNVIEEMAASHVYAMIERINKAAYEEEGCGEDWAFGAAENMVSEHEYTQSAIWSEAERLNGLMQKMSDEEQDAFIAAHDRKNPIPLPPEVRSKFLGLIEAAYGEYTRQRYAEETLK